MTRIPQFQGMDSEQNKNAFAPDGATRTQRANASVPRNQSRTGIRPLRVLHCLGGLNRGGIEGWLMQVLRKIDRSAIQFDFAVHTSTECAFDAEARELGCRI